MNENANLIRTENISHTLRNYFYIDMDPLHPMSFWCLLARLDMYINPFDGDSQYSFKDLFARVQDGKLPALTLNGSTSYESVSCSIVLRHPSRLFFSTFPVISESHITC